jgi:fused signal recognition particle receptor
MAFFFKRKDKETKGKEAEQTEPESTVSEAPAAPDTPESEAEIQPERDDAPPTEKTGLFKRLTQGLSKTRTNITGRMGRLVLGKKEITQDLLDELEEILFTSDIGVATTQELIDDVQGKVARRELKDPEKLISALRERILEYLQMSPPGHSIPDPDGPRVIMVIGVNGVGKTTTIAKAAHRFKSEGKRVMLVAADTFRAAAVEQLSVWGERIGTEVVKQKTGADPSAVAFDALAAAQSRNMDVVLIDTAGRLHTKANLMDELRKIHRVMGKKIPGAPHEVWLVLDATTGQNAISQAELFNDALHITDIILTKLDGTAKGGIVVGISHQLGIPIRFIGIGERMDDLRPFHPQEFVDAIFG